MHPPYDTPVLFWGNAIVKVIIVGGVAGGASCAARLRRLDEAAEILMVERGPYVSFANCGLPYHVGGVIERKSTCSSPASSSSATISRSTSGPTARPLRSCRIEAGQAARRGDRDITVAPYDKLVLAPGAVSVRPPLPGIDLPGIFHVRTVPDARAINEWIERGTPFLAGMDRYSGFQAVKPKRRAVVVGAGFIGLETAENLVSRLRRTLVELSEQVLPPLDPENARCRRDACASTE